MFYFGPMLFEVQALIFVYLIIFQVPLPIFVLWFLTKKELAPIWSIFLKSSTVKYLSNAVVNGPPNCGEKNFEPSCDQVVNIRNFPFWKNYLTVTEVVLIQVFFLTVGSKEKKMKTRNTMAPSYHPEVSSTQKGSLIFLLFSSWHNLVLYLHVCEVFPIFLTRQS